MRRFWKKTAVWVTIAGMLLTGCGKKDTEPDPEIDVADVLDGTDETGQPDTDTPAEEPEELPPAETARAGPEALPKETIPAEVK